MTQSLTLTATKKFPPQAPRRQFLLPTQASVESMNSETENEGTENLAPQLKSNKEDPETRKKKEIHKNLMSEALKQVELRNNQKKNFSQLSRTNPTIAALDIVTRKELKLEELEIKQLQEQEILRNAEMLRNRNRSGSSKIEPGNVAGSAVNQNVLQSFRQQGRKFMSCSYCQELCQQASWLLIGCIRIYNQS